MRIEDIKGDEVINCKTFEESVRISRLLDEKGFRWSSGETYLHSNKWETYSQNFCFLVKRGQYSDLSFYKGRGYKVIDSTEINKEMGTQIVTRQQLKQIYDIACSTWKQKIVEITNQYISQFEDTGELPEKLIKEMFVASNDKQKEVLLTIFKNPVEDKNLFVKVFDAYKLKDLSKELFENPYLVQIGTSSCPENRPDLEGKCFWVDESIEVIIHQARYGSTVIELKKK